MILKNTVYYNEAFLPQKGDIAVENEILAQVGGTQTGSGIDLSGCTVVPGFIDIHTHGAMGGDTCDAREESLAGMSRFLANHGVTSFCPTTMTPLSSLRKACGSPVIIAAMSAALTYRASTWKAPISLPPRRAPNAEILFESLILRSF